MNTNSLNEPDDEIIHPAQENIKMPPDRVYADRKETYKHWVQIHGKEEADRLADKTHIPKEDRLLS